MPAREHVLLSDAERATLFRIPTDPDELARRFTLEEEDLDLIGGRRHDRNRLGMALQFALIRHPGMTLAQVLQIEGGVPGPLVIFLARQLSVEPSVLSDYAKSITNHDRSRTADSRVDLGPSARTRRCRTDDRER